MSSVVVCPRLAMAIAGQIRFLGVRRPADDGNEDGGDRARAEELSGQRRHTDAPSGTKDTARLGERLRLVGHPVEDGRQAHDVEALVGERAEILGLTDLEGDASRPSAREGDALGEWVEPDDARP